MCRINFLIYRSVYFIKEDDIEIELIIVRKVEYMSDVNNWEVGKVICGLG